MNAQKLSFGSAFYGLLLLAAAAFCFWVNSYAYALLLFLSGMGIMGWAHFFNRRHYWGFRGLLAQLFVMTGIFGWLVLNNFREQPTFSNGNFNLNAFLFFGGLFVVTIVLLLVSVNRYVHLKRELE